MFKNSFFLFITESCTTFKRKEDKISHKKHVIIKYHINNKWKSLYSLEHIQKQQLKMLYKIQSISTRYYSTAYKPSEKLLNNNYVLSAKQRCAHYDSCKNVKVLRRDATYRLYLTLRPMKLTQLKMQSPPMIMPRYVMKRFCQYQNTLSLHTVTWSVLVYT